MKFWSKKNTNQSKTSFKEDFTLAERVNKRKLLEERYPKDSFSYLVIEGLNSFQNQQNSYIQYL